MIASSTRQLMAAERSRMRFCLGLSQLQWAEQGKHPGRTAVPEQAKNSIPPTTENTVAFDIHDIDLRPVLSAMQQPTAGGSALIRKLGNWHSHAPKWALLALLSMPLSTPGIAEDTKKKPSPPAAGVSSSASSGVTIRLQLRPSTPVPKEEPPPTSAGEPESEPNKQDPSEPVELQLDLQASPTPPNDTASAVLELTPDEPLSLTKSNVDVEQSNECPGSPDSSLPQQEPQPEDVPLEQEAHPYDAPAAETLAPAPRNRPARISDVPEASLTAREQRIQTEIQRCLQYFLDHPENTTRRGPWALMHATLPFGVEAEIVAGNRRVNAIGWMCYNGVCGKQRMFQPTKQGFRTNVGPGVQGHEGQFLAILAQSRVRGDYPLQVGNRTYTVMDLARYEMASCREKSELTFKLIGLSYYLNQNQSWRDDRGRIWNLEKMLVGELSQPINGAACGGTHRLMGMSFAIMQRQAAGLPMTSNWNRAEQYLNDYVNYAMSLQNPDGSFSTNWFESRGMDGNVERKVQTSGHILEWLVYTLPDDHLRSAKVQTSIEFLLNTLGGDLQRDWPIGPRGHALRALALYSQRVYGAQPGQMKAYLAQAASAQLR